MACISAGNVPEIWTKYSLTFLKVAFPAKLEIIWKGDMYKYRKCVRNQTENFLGISCTDITTGNVVFFAVQPLVLPAYDFLKKLLVYPLPLILQPYKSALKPHAIQ